MGSAVSSFANQVDVHVGGRLRKRREALGVSQGRLGRQLGLTFSQVQKYEKGSNRIGAGRLFEIASFLGVPVSYFFQGLDGAEQVAVAMPHGLEGPLQEEIKTLVEAFAAIAEAETRGSVLALVRTLTPSYAARRSTHS